MEGRESRGWVLWERADGFRAVDFVFDLALEEEAVGGVAGFGLYPIESRDDGRPSGGSGPLYVRITTSLLSVKEWI